MLMGSLLKESPLRGNSGCLKHTNYIAERGNKTIGYDCKGILHKPRSPKQCFACGRHQIHLI
ncbi:hypothetical protein F2P79_001136 [Pimephales promelas]|nr:hypothetical protein F2P79_001136 [Pimephales promelas]